MIEICMGMQINFSEIPALRGQYQKLLNLYTDVVVAISYIEPLFFAETQFYQHLRKHVTEMVIEAGINFLEIFALSEEY